VVVLRAEDFFKLLATLQPEHAAAEGEQVGRTSESVPHLANR
jgi:hypothetical protein